MKHKVINLEDNPVGKALNWVSIDVPLHECRINGVTYGSNLEIIEYLNGSDNSQNDEPIIERAVDDLISKIKLMVEEKDILPVSTGGLNITACVKITPEERYVIHINVLGSVSQEVLDFKYNLKKHW
tara:strand:- start:30137 stop:30517 length:381 start_codon:yes stop_codon:yes gene_type:complete